MSLSPTAQTFSLKPFPVKSPGQAPRGELGSGLSITGAVKRQNNALLLQYILSGELTTIKIPQVEHPPARKDGLWETTCFEFFLGIPNSRRYWEFNLSPSGNWNVYGFEGYRQGMATETAFPQLPFQVEQRLDTLGLDTLELQITLNLQPILPAQQPLEMAITAVIQSKSGDPTYWALKHPGPEADFHQRDGFTINL